MRIRGDGGIEEMVHVNITLGHMAPEIVWFQESDFPAKDFIKVIPQLQADMQR